MIARLPFVLMGAFNCVDDIQDRTKTHPTSISRSAVNYALNKMLTGLDLVDLWEKPNHSEPGHTIHHHSVLLDLIGYMLVDLLQIIVLIHFRNLCPFVTISRYIPHLLEPY